MKHRRIWPVLLGAAMALGMATTGATAASFADQGCRTLAERVDAVAGGGPVFLRSYDGAAGQGPIEEPALATAAFTYDNALAAIALTACGRQPQALRIGEALLLAATQDRAGPQGRLRNAYRAGPQPTPPPPNGWWDAGRNQWLEDDYQVGTATGNVAWAALALLTLAEDTGQPRFLNAAATLGQWAIDHTADGRGPGGFSGGIHGGEAQPRPLTWKSTEHNVDLAAVFLWLERAQAPGQWSQPATAARRFVDAMWDNGHFLTGTAPDGVTPNRATSGLDAQLWPLLLPDAPVAWRQALAYVETNHGAARGLSFNNDRSGMWTEGTAQAALSFRVAGQPAKADAYLAEIAREVSPGGYLWATPEPRITTGLAIGPDSTEADFFYYHRPHLGATAWGVIATTGWNPFGGQARIPSERRR